MRRLSGLLAVLALLALNACQQRTSPLHLCVLVDLSASIEPDARKSMFDAVEQIFPRLRRGDSLTIIPITGDADVESQGKIIGFELPKHRKVYDQDLRRLSAQARKALEDMQSAAASKPGAHTDILGALRVVSQELTGNSRKGIIILTDLVQDDGQFDFKRDPAVADIRRAQFLADSLAAREKSRLADVPLYVGRLRSRDFSLLSRRRRASIGAFWEQYLVGIGARAQIALDGSGLLGHFVESLEK
jgi:hypothetical protein